MHKEMEVDTALEMLLEAIETVINGLSDEIQGETRKENYEKAKEAIEMAERVSNFRDKVKELQREWKQVFSPALPSAPQRQRRRTRGRLPRGLKTPESAFRRPILESLVELGGRAPTGKVLELVERKMRPILNEYDYGHLSTGATRWQKTAQWCRYQMIQEGLLKDDSPYGIWEISEKGRRALEQGQV